MQTLPPEPCAANAWLSSHAERLLDAYRHWTGRSLIEPGADPVGTARALYEADFVVLSHDTAPDPRFDYANLAAQRLFERTWSEIIGLPSRFSAEPLARDERARLLEQVARQGYTDSYSGVRVSASGRRFLVRQATVWNLIAPDGTPCGQAAAFSDWQWL